MTSTAAQTEFVAKIAQEMVCGIEQAVDYWLSRIERQLVASALTGDERLRAIERVLREYKQITGKSHFGCARA